MATATTTGVTTEQATGAACIVCGRNLDEVLSVPMVLPASGRWVQVCADDCREGEG